MSEEQLLSDILHHAPADSLWCVDENLGHFIPPVFVGKAVSNRVDIANKLKNAGITTAFNDFELPAAENGYQQIVWRISKEKAVNLHIINKALQLLAAGGQLHIIGYKNEGMASLGKYIGQASDAVIERQRHKKQLFHFIVDKPGQLANTDDYHALHWLNLDGTGFYSKPGVFGWQKIDAGSRLLVEALKQQPVSTTKRLLDLGCGYGYLAVKARQMGFSCIDACDNNAAAVVACQTNFDHYAIDGHVSADNAAQQLPAVYDMIVCNPPFHQGFDHQQDLTALFCQQAARLLLDGGLAFFVVNQFIGIEKQAARCFSETATIVQEQGFKVCIFKK